MNRLLKQKNSLAGIILTLLLFNGCSREEQKKEYIARVNDSYLTEEDLTAVPEGYSGQQFFKEEQIRNWVNRELLYQQALKEGILEDERYKNILKNSAKELAASMMIEKWYSENTPVYKPEEISNYFEQNKNSFVLSETAYLINIAEFGNEDRAVLFRSAAVETDWNKALNFFGKDMSLKNQQMNKLLYSFDLQPLKLNRIINELHPGEVSLIIPGEKDEFIVVKLISRFETGTIPPFEIIKEDAEKKFIASQKAELLKEYFETLYSSNDIDVKQ